MQAFDGHTIRRVWPFNITPGLRTACMDQMRERMAGVERYGLITPGTAVWQAASRTEIRMETTRKDLHAYADWYDCDLIEASHSGSDGSMSNWSFIFPRSADFRLERRVF